MKKKLFPSILAPFASLFLLLFQPLHAQHAEGTGSLAKISMTTSASVGELIMLSIDGDSISVEGAELKFGGMAEVKSPEITIRGVINGIDCTDAKLTALDLSQAPALQTLWCGSNSLEQLDVSMLPQLKILYCLQNKLTALNLGSNIALQELDCSENSLSTLDVTQNPALTILLAFHNQLPRIDLSRNPLLVGLDLSENQLTELSVVQNNALETIYCNGNRLVGEEMKRFIESLPDRANTEKSGHLFLIDTKNPDEKNCPLRSDVAMLKAKHWDVLDYSAGDNDGKGIPYEGVSDHATACPHSLGNPTFAVDGSRCIVSKLSRGQRLALYTLDGTCLHAETCLSETLSLSLPAFAAVLLVVDGNAFPLR